MERKAESAPIVVPARRDWRRSVEGKSFVSGVEQGLRSLGPGIFLHVRAAFRFKLLAKRCIPKQGFQPFSKSGRVAEGHALVTDQLCEAKLVHRQVHGAAGLSFQGG